MDLRHRDILSRKRDILSDQISLIKVRNLLEAYNLFNRYMWQDINSMHDVFDLLPTRGPDAFNKFILILKKAGYETIAQDLENSTVDLFYRFPSKPVGQCLIINICNFDEGTNIEKRLGSEKDVESLTSFFQQIGYAVEKYADLESQKMKECMKKFADCNSRKADIFVIFIMSHGSHDKSGEYFYGKDGKHVYKNEIIDIFSNRNPHVCNKPKVFFFVACRGTKKDHGVLKTSSTVSTDSINCNNIPEVIPTRTDTLVVHSTLPQHQSIRSNDYGSWFCIDLVHFLQKHYINHDIEDIMIMVNESMRKRVSPEYGTQVAHRENFAFKKLYLWELPQQH